MAPNLKRTQLLLQTVDLDLVQPIKAAAFPPLTSEVVSSPVAPVDTTNSNNNSSYWTWSAENDQEIHQLEDEERLSADHIVDNIVREQQQPSSPGSLVACNDAYWDFSPAPKSNYWNWPSVSEQERELSRCQVSITADEEQSYWAW